MSLYRTSRQGEQLVKDALKGSIWADHNGHDLEWEGIKIDVKTRGAAGRMGNTAFTFAHFKDQDCVYVLVGIQEDQNFFWVLRSSDVKSRTSYYASLKDCVEYKDLPKAIRELK